MEPIFYGILIQPATIRTKSSVWELSYALYATDVKFQLTNQLTSSFIDVKTYYSAKCKMYGYKIEASVAYSGIAVDVSAH